MAVERSAERDAAIAATLPHVPFDGWTRRHCARDWPISAWRGRMRSNCFPAARADMIEAFCDLADRRWRRAPPFWTRACGCTNGCAR